MNALIRSLPFVLAASVAARAQGEDPREEIRKKMEEISTLMRESEQLLLELSKVDRLVQSQQEVVEKLRELDDSPPPAGQAESTQRDEQRRNLQESQEKIRQKLAELTEGQQKRGEQLVRSIEELLRSLPRSRQPSSQPSPEPRGEREREKRDPQDNREQKQPSAGDPEKRPRSERERRPGEKKPEEDFGSPENLKRIEVWIARLPPEEKERLLHGDLSHVPTRYRPFIEAYTIARAKREATEREAGSR